MIGAQLGCLFRSANIAALVVCRQIASTRTERNICGCLRDDEGVIAKFNGIGFVGNGNLLTGSGCHFRHVFDTATHRSAGNILGVSKLQERPKGSVEKRVSLVLCGSGALVTLPSETYTIGGSSVIASESVGNMISPAGCAEIVAAHLSVCGNGGLPRIGEATHDCAKIARIVEVEIVNVRSGPSVLCRVVLQSFVLWPLNALASRSILLKAQQAASFEIGRNAGFWIIVINAITIKKVVVELIVSLRHVSKGTNKYGVHLAVSSAS